ncbi:MAG: nucleotide-binding protein [Phycisphaerae bacterium]|nr:nucleotide-binding protein [Phycisphaerae bacterium]
MATINQGLLREIMRTTGLSQGAVYARIKQTADSEYLPRHLAAIKVGAEVGVTINKYASTEDLAQLRQAGTPVMPPTGKDPGASPVAQRAIKIAGKSGKKPSGAKPNQVFVVHGRDLVAKVATFAFLRSVGVKPIEWNAALAMSKKAAPFIGEILDAAFGQARAVVVLLTPDDLAQLRPDLVLPNDKPYERTPTGQARPNVLFEAGMAFATHPGQTILVQLGHVREFSDVAGRHVVHMTNDYAKRQEFATKLKNAGCDVDTSGSDWVTAGDFTDPQARVPVVGSPKRKLRI